MGDKDKAAIAELEAMKKVCSKVSDFFEKLLPDCHNSFLLVDFSVTWQTIRKLWKAHSGRLCKSFYGQFLRSIP